MMGAGEWKTLEPLLDLGKWLKILGPKKMSKVLTIMFYSRQLGHLHRPFLPWSASIAFLLAAVPSSTALHRSDEGKWGFESPFWSLSAEGSWGVHKSHKPKQLWNAGKLIRPEQLYSLRAKQLGYFSLTTQFFSVSRHFGDFCVFSIYGQERRGGRNTNASDFATFLVVWLILSLRPLYRCVCRCF